MKKLTTFIKVFDLFGYPVSLTVDGSKSYKTVQGGAVSLAYLVYFFYSLVIALIPVFLREIDSSQTML